MQSKQIINTDEITNEEIERYYNEENHSQRECAQYFNLSVGMFIDLLKKRNIKKDKQKHTEMIKKRKMELYGDPNYNNRDSAKQTCMEKYGVDNPFKDKEKIKQSYLDHGYDHPMHNEEILQKNMKDRDYSKIIDKCHKTYFERTGYDNPGKNPECIKKGLETKIKNGVYDSPGTSNIERRLEKILKRKFENVISHYRDSRYARESGYQFECDFYIPEEDLFIELNAYPTHSDHPFNINEEKDVEESLRLKDSDKYWEVDRYNTWVVRDFEKINYARKNNLNYIILYPTNSIFNNQNFNDKKYKDLIKYLLLKLNKKE